MEKLLDRIVTVIFILALAAISFFVFKWVVNESGESGKTNDAELVEGDDPFSDNEYEGKLDNEDEDYYNEDEEVESSDVPKEYEDEIASIMEDVTGGNEVTTTENTDNNGSNEKNTNESPKTDKTSVEAATAGNNSNTNSSSTNKTKSSTSSAKHLLVAGSFTTRANAETQVNTLKKEGYNPEIVNFNNSKMYTVLAGRYWSISKAHEASDQLKLKKYECYVHTKR